MARVKSVPVTRRRHKKVLKAAKGFFGGRRRLYRSAKESVKRAWAYATKHRRRKKREFRQLWNARISAASRENGMTYSRFVSGLKKSNVRLNRKSLSELAQTDKAAFKELVELAKSA